MKSFNAATMSEHVFKRDRKPWYQLPGESDDAYTTFCLFLNMGCQRLLNNLAAMIDKWTIDKRLLSVEQLGLWAVLLLGLNGLNCANGLFKTSY